MKKNIVWLLIKKTLFVCLMTTFTCLSCKTNHATQQNENDFTSNPIDTGYYADPTIIKYNDEYIIYATIDPWGAKESGVLTTKDFKRFTPQHLN